MVEEQEAQMEHSEAQTIEGYGCTCGFKTDNAEELRIHVMRGALMDGKGTHKSLGRINMQTGEVIMPPWNKRAKEQKQRSTVESTHRKHDKKHAQMAQGVAQGN